jgi:ADP-heptose:LPS heptosyltransferase
MPEVSPSVLIIRLDAIGDALALTPLLAALRRRGLPVDIVLRHGNAGIFSSRAARQVFVAEFELRSSASSNLAAIARLGRELRGRNYSHVLVATEDPGGYRLAAAVGAPVRIGFCDPWGKPLKAVWSRRLLTRGIYRSAGLDPRAPHECEVLFALGAPLVAGESPTSDMSELRPLVLEHEPPPADAVALQITDKWERLGIPMEHVLELIARLSAYGEPALLSAAREADYARRIAASTGIAIRYFDDLEPWKIAIASAPALVTPDCGALHVAGMTGTPVVAVFPPQPAYALHVARWAPWAAPHRIVRADPGWQSRAADAVAPLLG